MKGTQTLVRLAVIYLLTLGMAPADPAAPPNSWKPATRVDLTEVAAKSSERARTDPLFVKQPTILAYRTALFLAGGSFDEPTLGRTQSIKADFGPGEGPFDKGTVVVEFMGYADDSLIGERFTFTMNADQAGHWQIVEAKREAYGRGDQK